jgi:hypothetical protein
MLRTMSRTILARYLTPAKFRRDEEAKRIRALRERDGDTCSRCRRPLRFDLTPGHDSGPKVESLAAVASGEPETLDHCTLTHRRCHAEGVDHTGEVQERVRRKNEAELFAKSRKRRRA